MKKFTFLAVIFLIFTASVRSQKSGFVNVKDSMVSVPMIMPFAVMTVPLGDMGKRYGLSWQIGGQFLFKTKTNWLFGASGAFIFGENVNEPTLMQPIFPILASDGTLPTISVGLRGFSFFGQAGKIIPLGKKPNRNSGLMLMYGAGFMQHQILTDIRGQLTPQAEGKYGKGYDRLTNGFAMSQFIGYLFLGNNRSINFYVGLDLVEGFTKNRRGYNYDTASPDNGDKFDFMIGLKAGWSFPIYARGSRVKKEKEYIYY